MSAPAASYKAVVAALGANICVTAIKFVAFFLSGSGAMLSESIHSAADAGNQFLLFLGLKRGTRERDDEFHYGYGGERFIFGMLSASGIFFIGCGVTVYHGVNSLFAPHMPEIGVVTFAVLGVSLVVEGGSMLFAVVSISKERKGMPFFRYVRERADPAAVAILLEDGAAVLGLFLAAVGIVLSYATQNPLWDSLGSIVVGLILGYIAVHLVLENRELLLGKAVPHGVQEKFVEIVRARPSIRDVHDVKTRQLTPETYKLKAEITLNEEFFAKKLEAVVPADGAALLAERRGETLRVIATATVTAVSDEIDAIEDAIRAQIPEAKHIDLEVDHTPDEQPAKAGAA